MNKAKKNISMAAASIITTVLVGLLALAATNSGNPYYSSPLGLLSFPWVHSMKFVKHNVDLERSMNRPKDVLYIFVIDCSESVARQFKSPSWVSDVLDRLGSRRPKEWPVQPSWYDINKLGLFALLAATEDISANAPETTTRFAIWNVCGSGRAEYPESGEPETVQRKNIHNAVKNVMENKPSAEDVASTNFTKLLPALVEQYGLGPSSQGKVVLTIISDFEDDPPDEDKTPAMRRKLDVAMERLSMGDIYLNAVVVPPGGSGGTDLLERLERTIMPLRLRRIPLDEINNDPSALLVPVDISNERVYFCLDGGLSPSADVSLMLPDHCIECDVRLSLVADGRRADSPEFLRAALRPADGKSDDADGSWKRVTSRANLFSPVSYSSKILLRYEGSVRPDPLPLRVSVDNHGFIMPIHFIDRVPRSMAILIAALYLVLGTAVVFAVIKSLYFIVSVVVTDRFFGRGIS